MKFSKNITFLILSFLLVHSSFAQINPENITIVRDRWGVPHIFAKTDPEVAYGLAFAHAEDDFKTIQLPLLGGKQMLGRHLGKKGAAADYVAALLRIDETVKNQYETALSPEYKALLSGYVQGINEYARTHPQEVLVKGSFPITNQDAVKSAVLSMSVFSGIDRSLKEIFDGSIQKIVVDTTRRKYLLNKKKRNFSNDFLENNSLKASNAFAMNSQKTTDGKVYLNINSHQPLEGPAAWYEAHLQSEEGWNIHGGLFPGAATILHGNNENLGWAHTVNYHDKLDVYHLQMSPDSPMKYKFDDQWLDLEERVIKLKVKVAGIPITVKKKAYWSKYGPTVMGPTGTFALRFAANQEIRMMEQWYKMNKAQNFSEFKKALEMTAVTGFNIIYADKNDTIFYVTNGKIPIRKQGFDWQKTLPGNTSETLWTQFHPFSDLPQILNPKSGYVFNMNNTPYSASAPNDNLKPENFDPTMGIERWQTNRSQRFMELIENYGKINYDDFKKIKYDLTLPKALQYFADASAINTMNPSEFPDIKESIKKMQIWDKTANADSKEAVLFMLFYDFITKKIIWHGELVARKLTVEECVEGIRFAQDHLMKNFKTTNVTLGDVQKLVRGKKELPVFGINDVLAAISSKPYKNGTYKAAQGESYIQLVKFSKEGLPEIETVNCYGASNHEGSPHYDDQMELFVKQKTKKMTLDKATVIKEAERVYHPK
jgi:acyl-homoserine-lactone acylase